MRDLAGESAQEDSPFFVSTRGRLRGLPLSTHQVERVFASLRAQLDWRNRGIHHAPRIHDLRHTFVVRRIVLWQTQGVDIDQAMLSLSTYVGHAMVTNTYWYLSAVPELMSLAAGRFESYMHRTSRSHGPPLTSPASSRRRSPHTRCDTPRPCVCFSRACRST
jgi:integrase